MMTTAFAALAFVLSIGLNSCMKDDVVTPEDYTSIEAIYSASSNYIMPAYNAEEEYVPATTETECEYRQEAGVQGREEFRKHKGLFLGEIFREMKVTREQMKEFRLFLAEFEKCKREAQSLTNEQIRELIRQANEKVKEVIALIRSGEITREEGKARIEVINQALREKIASGLDQDARCQCLRDLFQKIYEKLTDEQKLIWDEWKAKLEDPCLTPIRQ